MNLEEHLMALEERLLRPNMPEDGALLADDFVEFGSSGRVFDRSATIELLAGARPHFVMSNFRMTLLAPEAALVTYRINAPRESLRSSVWVLRNRRWQILFHQGTAVTSESARQSDADGWPGLQA